MVKVTIENLVKKFGQVAAVDHVSMAIDDGSFTCLLGPSGCGKTTTLRMIAGLESQDEGSIFFDDRPVDELSPGDRNVSMVFQFYAIYPNMSVFDEIAFPLKMMKRPQQEIHDRVKRAAETVGLEASLAERAARLTADQKQRIELARAIIREPDVFLFDEPLTNLDTNLRAEMRAEIARIQKELSTTTIYVTHDQAEAMALADKIAIMHSGRIAQYDAGPSIYETPRNLFVAGFIGTPPMNFFNCHLGGGGKELLLEPDGFSISLSAQSAAALSKFADEEVVCGIRPEYIAIGGVSEQGCLRASVDVIEPLGHRLIVNARLGSTTLKVNSLPLNLTEGQQVGLRIPADRLRVFSRKDGELII